MFETNLDKAKYEAEYNREREEAKRISDKLVKKMIDGELENLDLEIALDSISPSRKCYMSTYVRGEFTKTSWMVITRQWLQSIKRLTEGKTVLEVCAGHGLVTKLMNNLGCNWRATSLDTGYVCKRSEWVEELDAIDAVEKYWNEFDIIFASWIPYKDDIDCELAKYHIPMIIVGEEYGCTGSEDFWLDCQWERARDKYPWFMDVDKFYGIHDSTFLINWK